MNKQILKIVPFILVILLSLGALRGLTQSGYFNIHDDLQVMRLLEMEKCLKDGQIPCRWVPDMGYGYGFPLYNYYAPGPYYLGALIKILLGISLLDTVKVLFGLSILVSAVSMYFLAKNFWGSWGAVLSAVLFVYAPYHSLDIYVRGAMNEVWGLSLFPLILLSFYKLSIKKDLTWIIFTSLSLTGLFLSHSIMTLIFTPVAILWFAMWVFINRSYKTIFTGISSIILAFGLASFFLIPAVLEQPLVQINNLTSDYFYFGSHFPSLYQLFIKRTWGFGPSEFGINDKLSFQIGWPHWWILLALIILIPLVIGKVKVEREKLYLMLFLFIFFVFSLFMSHAKSFFVWEKINTLHYIQFPWRFLSMIIFINAFLAGSLTIFVSNRIKYILVALVCALTIVLNIGYFDFERHYLSLTDQIKLSGEDLRLQKQAGLLDYLPVTVSKPPETEAPERITFLAGEGSVGYFNKRTDYFGVGLEVQGEKSATIQIPIFDFPYWQIVEYNNIVLPHYQSSELGLLTVELKPGKHDIAGWFTNTPIRLIANLVTLLSLITILMLAIFQNKNSLFKKHD